MIVSLGISKVCHAPTHAPFNQALLSALCSPHRLLDSAYKIFTAFTYLFLSAIFQALSTQAGNCSS